MLTFYYLSMTSTQLNSTQLNSTQLKVKLFLILMLLAGNFYFSFGQTTSGIAITWNGEIGCQVYGQEDPREGEKEPIFIEEIGTGNCYRFCENSYVVYVLSNLPVGSVVTWSALGGSIVQAGVYIIVIKQNNSIILQQKLIIE